MYIITGGAGFIGSNLVRGLNRRGIKDILVVDDLTDGTKFRNLVDLRFFDYVDKDRFLRMVESRDAMLSSSDAVFHQGACSTTTEWNGKFMMENNYDYSKALLALCREQGRSFIYASSAAVYGRGPSFVESGEVSPLNVYGYSKLLFDRHVEALVQPSTQIVGLRYFNVYGPGEEHKGAMTSVAYQFFHQLRSDATIKLFEGSDGFGPGEQRRDFVHVDDVVAVNLWFLDHPKRSGIFNVGTGRARSFNDVGRAAIAAFGAGQIRYVEFPPHLRGRYQSSTQANLERLRGSGCDVAFRDVDEGVAGYFDVLKSAQ